MSRLKFVAELVAGQSPDSEAVSSLVAGLPFIQGNAEFGDLHPSPKLQAVAPPKRCRAGDILISVRAPVGALNIADQDLGIGRGLCAIRPTTSHLGFVWWLLHHGRTELLSRSTGSTFDAISASTLGALSFPELDFSTQRAIADYLDRETAQIDTLIAKQEQLIATLRERRIAVITHFVIGDHLPADTLDSPWYRRMPTGWVAGRVKSFAHRITDGAHISPDTVNGEFPFVSTRDVSNGHIDIAGSLRTSRETYEYMVRTGCQPRLGDVLFSKDGTVGETTVIEENQPFVVASSLVIITPDLKRAMPGYLSYALNARVAKEQARAAMRGAGLPRLSVGNLARLELLMPPVKEQLWITRTLDEQTAKIDALIAKAERFIELSKERRAALITAAVTGQLEVPAA